MALQKPTIFNINEIDATNNYTVRFSVNGGDMVVGNIINITNSDSQLVYDDSTISYEMSHTIPTNTLTNGELYTVKIKTFDELGNESEWSDSVTFYCFSKPTITLNILENEVIKLLKYPVSITYNQTENEKISYITAELFKGNILISTSGRLTSLEVPPINFIYNITLVDKESYTLKISVYTEHGGIYIYNTKFSTKVEIVKEQYLNLSLDNCKGKIEAECCITNIGAGISNPITPTYIDNKLDLISCVCDYNNELSKWVKWESFGVDIPQNFLLRCWINISRYSHKILKLYSTNDSDYLELTYNRGTNSDYIVLTTNSGTIMTLPINKVTNIFQEQFIWIKHISGTWEFKTQFIDNGQPSFINWNSQINNCRYNCSPNIAYKNEQYGDFVPQANNIVTFRNNTNSIIITNGIFAHLNISKDTSLNYNTNIPTIDNQTLFDCNFNNNIIGGEIYADKLELYKKNSTDEDWYKILDKNLIDGSNDVIYNEYVFKNGEELQYKAVYYYNNVIVKTVIKTISPKVNKVFISDNTNSFGFISEVIYSDSTQNVQTGVLIPIGSKYPIVIQNANTNYRSGSMSIKILGYDYEENMILNRNSIRKQADDFIAFLENKKGKLIKDWNGNIYAVKIVESPTLNYDGNYGNGIITVGFNWVEQCETTDINALEELEII